MRVTHDNGKVIAGTALTHRVWTTDGNGHREYRENGVLIGSITRDRTDRTLIARHGRISMCIGYTRWTYRSAYRSAVNFAMNGMPRHEGAEN